MISRQHPSNNQVAPAPRGVEFDICKAAPVTVYEDPVVGKCIQTFWSPTEEELLALNQGAFVMVTFLGIIPMHRVEVAK